jgi:hypothetical protein
LKSYRIFPGSSLNLHLDKCTQEKQTVEGEVLKKATSPAMEQVAVTSDMTPHKYNDSAAKDSPDAQGNEHVNSTRSPSGVKTSTDSVGKDQDTPSPPVGRQDRAQFIPSLRRQRAHDDSIPSINYFCLVQHLSNGHQFYPGIQDPTAFRFLTKKA